MSDRGNFRNYEELDAGCHEARKILKRRRASIEDIRNAALLLNKSVRTLRAWIGSREDTVRYLGRRIDRLQRELRFYGSTK